MGEPTEVNYGDFNDMPAASGNGALPYSPAAKTNPPDNSRVSVVTNPNIVTPQKRGGLAGLLDEVADDIAGTKGPGKVYTDAEGNQYIQHPTMTHKQQWLKIAGEAIRGAGAGAGAHPGPGQNARAFSAGTQEAVAQDERENARDQQQIENVRKANQDRFNQIKMKHEIAGMEFDLGRRKVEATEHDIAFSQQQADRMEAMVKDGKAFDLGTYKDEADLARIKEMNPDFWKDVHQNDISIVPVLDDKGVRQGIRVYKTTPGIANEIMPARTSFKVFTPGKKPGDPPTLEDHVASEPITFGQWQAYNNSAYLQYQKAQDDANKASLSKSEERQHNAEARNLNSEAAARDAERAETGPESVLVQDTVKGQIIPERLGYMLGKKEGQQFLTAVAKADPNLDISKLQGYPKMYADYVDGKMAQSKGNLNTAFMHLEDLRGMNTVGSRIPGTDAAHAYENKLVNVSAEVANGLAKPGSTATKDEIGQVKKSLSPFLNRDSAITTQMHSLIEQYKTMRGRWVEGAPSRVYEGKMPDLSPEAQEVVRKYAPEDANAWWGRPVVLNGQTVGYTKDGVNMTPVPSKAGGQ